MNRFGLPVGRYLVAGGAGFVGSHLVDRIITSGGEAIVLDSLDTGCRANLDAWSRYSAFTFLQHDLTLPLPALGKLDGIFHFAVSWGANCDLDGSHPDDVLERNTMATRHLLAFAKENECSILITSGERPDELERSVEALAEAHRHSHHAAPLIVRLPEIYGPRMRLDDNRCVSASIRRALARSAAGAVPVSLGASYFYIEDAADGIVRAFSNPKDGRTVVVPTELLRGMTRTPPALALERTLAFLKRAPSRWRKAS